GDIAHVDVVAEAHALDHAAIAHVQAGDDAAAQHVAACSASYRLKRRSSRARPRTMPAQPASRARVMSTTLATPPEACTASPGATARRSAYSARFGPANIPSRAISVLSRWRRPASA